MDQLNAFVWLQSTHFHLIITTIATTTATVTAAAAAAAAAATALAITDATTSATAATTAIAATRQHSHDFEQAFKGRMQAQERGAVQRAPNVFENTQRSSAHVLLEQTFHTRAVLLLWSFWSVNSNVNVMKKVC
jgi:uncharacterized protein YyaL (SSP411 family)